MTSVELEQAVAQWWATARESWPTLPETPPTVLLNLRGTYGGWANGPAHTVRLNASLAERVGGEYNETIGHEIAHIVAYQLHGRGIGHSQPWQDIMVQLGLEPKRCHAYDTKGLEARKMNYWPYKCDCRDWQLSTTRANRHAMGTRVYRCPDCKVVLVSR